MSFGKLSMTVSLLFGIVSVASADVVTRVIHFTHGDVVVEGVIAWDDTVTTKRPGAIIIHGGWGYSNNVRAQAERLAESGYVGYAVDMYGMGPVDTHLEDDRGARKLLNDNPVLRAVRFSLAIARLKQDPHVDPEKISAVGYCWGGEVILEMARAGAELDAVVTFAGILSTSNPAKKGYVKPRILVLHGDSDPYAPLEQVEAFKQEMTDAAADFEVVVYPGVEHAFTQPYARDVNMRGISYDADADRNSWEAMLKLFEQIY